MSVQPLRVCLGLTLALEQVSRSGVEGDVVHELTSSSYPPSKEDDHFSFNQILQSQNNSTENYRTINSRKSIRNGKLNKRSSLKRSWRRCDNLYYYNNFHHKSENTIGKCSPPFRRHRNKFGICKVAAGRGGTDYLFIKHPLLT